MLEAVAELAEDGFTCPTTARLRCFRGIDTLCAAGLCAEIGDFRRFAKAPQLAGYLGITPSEWTSDERRHQGAITKAGPKPRSRRLLVEAAPPAQRATSEA